MWRRHLTPAQYGKNPGVYFVLIDEDSIDSELPRLLLKIYASCDAITTLFMQKQSLLLTFLSDFKGRVALATTRLTHHNITRCRFRQATHAAYKKSSEINGLLPIRISHRVDCDTHNCARMLLDASLC